MIIKWEIDSGGHPKLFHVNEDDIEDCETFEQAKEAIEELLENDFAEKVKPYIANLDPVDMWVKEVIQKRM